MTILEAAIQTSRKKRPATRYAYLRAVRDFIKFAGRDQRRWTTDAVERWRDALGKRGLAPLTVNSRLAALKFAARRCEDLHGHRSFARAAEFLPVVRQKTRRAPSIDDARRFLAACSGRRPADLRDTAMFTLGFRTGLRRESLVKLRIEDIRGRRIKVMIKGGRIHELTVDDDVVAALQPWMEFLRNRRITAGPVFRSLAPTVTAEGVRVGDALHPASVNRIMASRCVQAGVQLHPHLMRHAFVSWAVQAGVPTARIMAMTGHRTTAMIAEYLSDLRADTEPVGNLLPALG